ncbi:hypothetical protein U1Q18_005033, partial [Sarracenia purpurea var. burkii]
RGSRVFRPVIITVGLHWLPQKTLASIYSVLNPHLTFFAFAVWPKVEGPLGFQ